MSKSSKSPVFNLGLSDKMEAELLELLRDLTSNKKVDHSRVLPNLSQAELTILRSNSPIGVTDSEEITVFGQRGILMNKTEINSWRGDRLISEYHLNEDNEPLIVHKKMTQELEYVQELAVRYLRPPTPPSPGEIVITQEPSIPTKPAPPLIIRQVPRRLATPSPLIIREAPPKIPAHVKQVKITISGKRLPPPPRRVIIERLAPLPMKPQPIIIERWLPYREQKRKVVLEKNLKKDPVPVKPRNMIIQWEQPEIQIRKQVRFLGIINANPAEYRLKYEDVLKDADQLPEFVKDIKTPTEIGKLASEEGESQETAVPELEGDLEALKLIDLEAEGLGAYRSQLAKLGIVPDIKVNVTSKNSSIKVTVDKVTVKPPTATASGDSRAINNEIISRIFQAMYKDRQLGYVSRIDAESVFLRINERLGYGHGPDYVKQFFDRLDQTNSGVLSIQEFKTAFAKILP